MFLLAFVALIFILALRIAFVFINPSNPSKTKGNAVIVLGSGGHTGELLAWMKLNQDHSDTTKNRKFIFIVSATDSHSALAAKTFCMNSKIVKSEDEVVIKVIPRAREVGQSYFSSIFTTLNAIAACVGIMYELNAATIVSNGPGVAVPVVLADIIVAAFLPFQKTQRASLCYIESFACVDHVSLSGKIFLNGGFCQKFLVQWPKLMKVLQRNHGNRKVQYSGPFALSSSDQEQQQQGFSSTYKEVDFSLFPSQKDLNLLSFNSMMGSHAFHPLKPNPNQTTGTLKKCVVTVGSTKFEDLIKICNTPEFDKAMVRLGIEELLIQQGACKIMENGETTFTDEQIQLGSLRKKIVVNYKHGLQKDIQESSLVISHAGAGTILEAVNAHVPIVVVPNNKLMANHQLELALALASRGHLLCADVSQLIELLLQRLDVDWRRFKEMPKTNYVAFNEATKGYFQVVE